MKQIKDFTSGKELFLPVHNRFDHTNFNELKIKYQYGDVSGVLKNVDIKPHTKGELAIPAQNWEVNKNIQISFYGQKDMLIDEYMITIGS